MTEIYPRLPNQIALLDGAPVRLMVVGDSKSNRTLPARWMWQQRNLVEVTVHDRKASARIGTLDFDVVLFDVIMPEPGGYEMLRRFKANPALRPSPEMAP